MKQIIVLIIAILLSIGSFMAQEKATPPKALEYSDLIDTANYPLYVSDLTYEYDFEKSENELIGKYASLTSMILQKYVNTDDIENCDYDATKNLFMLRAGKLFDYNIADGTGYYCSGGLIGKWLNFYYINTDIFFDGCILNIKKSIRYLLAQNKDFRDALFDKTCDFICDLTMLFPKDFKSHIISEINVILNILNDIPTHKYELASYNSENRSFYFKKDGIKNEGIGHTKTGWILRRIYIDKIPYEEIKQKTEKLLARVQGIDNSNNADIAYIYRIANGISYCVGGKKSFLYSNATSNKYSIDGIIETNNENGKSIFLIKSYEKIDENDQYYQKGFRYKISTLKLDEDGNIIGANVEYGK